jgi:hypothetical protein
MEMNNFIIPENLAISDSGFLFLSSTGETFTLNETGREVLKLLQQKFSYSEIVEKISNDYDVDLTEFEKDLDDFISRLKNYSLLKIK